MINLGNIKATAVAVHDTIVLDAVDRLTQYAAGALRREAQRQEAMRRLVEAFVRPQSKVVDLGIVSSTEEAVEKFRSAVEAEVAQHERDEFFGDVDPLGASGEAGTWLSDPAKWNPAGPGRFA